jgi:Uma2 family endonuclease
MATVSRIGPADHGRPLTLEEFTAGDYEEGYHYELIDGRLYVSPAPNQPENWVQEWLSFKLKLYAASHPDVINHVTSGARVFIPGRPGVTTPEPDLAAYRRFRLRRRIQDIRWQDVSPVLVAEILSADDPDKDLVRNADLYFQVPSVKEYWVLDARDDADYPRLRAHRRHGGRWRVLEVGPGAAYTTRLLPDFELVLDSRT